MWQKADDILGFEQYIKFAGGSVVTERGQQRNRTLLHDAVGKQVSHQAGNLEIASSNLARAVGVRETPRQHQLEQRLQDLSRRLAREQQTVSRLLRAEDEWMELVTRWQWRAYCNWGWPFLAGFSVGFIAWLIVGAAR